MICQEKGHNAAKARNFVTIVVCLQQWGARFRCHSGEQSLGVTALDPKLGI